MYEHDWMRNANLNRRKINYNVAVEFLCLAIIIQLVHTHRRNCPLQMGCQQKPSSKGFHNLKVENADTFSIILLIINLPQFYMYLPFEMGAECNG